MTNQLMNEEKAGKLLERPWHTLAAETVTSALEVTASRGLSHSQALSRLTRFGPNRLGQEKRESLLEAFFEEIREPMILLLLGTGLLYGIFGELSDALTILVVILIVVGVEIFNERRAGKAIAALNRIAEPTALVQREETYQEIAVEEVVPGDILLLGAGRRIVADARLVETYSLAVNEATLTGESGLVEKEADLSLSETTPLAERRNLIFSGTTVYRGRGVAVVVATGEQTELGRVAALARKAKPPRTPLQVAMRELTRLLIWLALGFSLLIPLLGWLRGGQSFEQMILTGLSLAFATIPEELPILITLVLALGAYRLSKQQAIVKQLRAVESLGAVTVIATDKTGTLTENRLQVSQFYPEAARSRLLEIGVLCNEATETGTTGQYQGDPLEVALLVAAHQVGIDRTTLKQTYTLKDEFSFDNIRKRMSAVYEVKDSQEKLLRVVVKGAPEAILALSTRQHTSDSEIQPLNKDERQSLLATNARLAGEGLRVIALAEKIVSGSLEQKLSQAEAEQELIFVGLVGLIDPPRPEIQAVLAECHSAGIRTIMITGDHPLTATAIARTVGLETNERFVTGPELKTLSEEALAKVMGEVKIYARTTPEDKLRLVKALQAQGARVAVTGDGINDAPALAAADIGIAMGQTGTDVAREAADLVLADDNFATIVRAIEEGRVLFANLRKAVRYYLACKVALILITLLPVLLGVPVPFAPVQIILLELFMDLAASTTFISERAETDLMRQPPRNPRTPFMNRAMLLSLFSSAFGLFGAVSFTYLVSWYSSAGLAQAQTMAFVTWLLGHVLLALNLRSEREPLLKLGLFSNRLMLIWGGAALIFGLLVTLLPGIQTILKTTSLSVEQWLLTVGAALLGTFWLEVRKWFSSGLKNW